MSNPKELSEYISALIDRELSDSLNTHTYQHELKIERNESSTEITLIAFYLKLMLIGVSV